METECYGRRHPPNEGADMRFPVIEPAICHRSGARHPRNSFAITAMYIIYDYQFQVVGNERMRFRRKKT